MARHAGNPYAWITPPSDDEKHLWLRSGQHRWLPVVQVLAYGGVAWSLYGLSRQSYWTLALLAPMALYLVEQLLSLRTSTHRRRVTLLDHQLRVETWAPQQVPSVDVFVAVAGEDPDMIDNTLRYTAALSYPGVLRTFVLDDAADPRVRALAARYGFDYLARPGSAFKKAGNLQHAFERTCGDVVVILDADYASRPDLLTELVPYLDDPSVGIVQAPQYMFTEKRMHWLERCAGATQEMFYRFVQPSRDAVGATICCGGSAAYRRAALEAIGGFPLVGSSEDIITGLELAKAGYCTRYVPVLVTRCASPDELDGFVRQQYRWCEGSMMLLTQPEFHEQPSMTLDQRLGFWSGFLYYFSTAANAVLAPVGVLLMIWVYPSRVASSNIWPLVPATLLWVLVFPLVATGRWRIEVWRVQVIYGFAHLFCVIDIIRGKMSEWVPTNSKVEAPLGWRVRRAMMVVVTASQTAITVGLVRDTLRFGFGHFWGIVLLSAFNAYIYVPVAALCIRRTVEVRRERHEAAREQAQPPAQLPVRQGPQPQRQDDVLVSRRVEEVAR